MASPKLVPFLAVEPPGDQLEADPGAHRVAPLDEPEDLVAEVDPTLLVGPAEAVAGPAVDVEGSRPEGVGHFPGEVQIPLALADRDHLGIVDEGAGGKLHPGIEGHDRGVLQQVVSHAESHVAQAARLPVVRQVVEPDAEEGDLEHGLDPVGEPVAGIDVDGRGAAAAVEEVGDPVAVEEVAVGGVLGAGRPPGRLRAPGAGPRRRRRRGSGARQDQGADHRQAAECPGSARGESGVSHLYQGSARSPGVTVGDLTEIAARRP